MNDVRLTRLAMMVAGCMLAHHVAGKALRDAVFLDTWGAARLPAIVFASAILVVAAVPIFANLLSRFGPATVVPTGFLLSAAGHVAEWQLSSRHPWVSIVIYLHVAGFGALLLSGFWSHVSELFDPKAAKANFGRIAAAGTLGGLGGGLAAERMAALLPGDATLLFLAGAHSACAAGMWLLASGRPAALPADTGEPPARMFVWDALKRAPHLKTLAVLIAVTTAGAVVVDYLLKAEAVAVFADRARMQRFFALFYTAVAIATFVAQIGVKPAVQRLGIGRTVSSLPLGFGAASIAALLFPVFATFTIARGIESMLRGSLFRSGYELLFVPMDPAEKRRTKTFLDVTCDRGGEAIGALVIQVLLSFVPVFLTAELLAVAIATSLCALWLGSRLDAMYVGVVERRLVGQVALATPVIGSESGWTVIDLPAVASQELPRTSPATAISRAREPVLDPKLLVLADLQSGDRRRVERTLSALENPDTAQISTVIQLLAWDDVVAEARRVLEARADRHVGLLIDAMLDPDTDFAIRRRLPRIIGTLASQRAIDGLVDALEDARFEVRYQAGRAMDRLLVKNGALKVDAARLMSVVDRELSVPVQIWRGHHLIDRDEAEDENAPAAVRRAQKNIEHIFSILAAVLPREPLQVALGGISSDDRGLRGLAREYLDSVLPASVRAKLWRLMDAPAGDGGRSPDAALEALRRSQGTPLVGLDDGA